MRGVKNMSAETATTKSKKMYMHSIIGIAIMFGFGLLPPVGALTSTGMDYLGILFGLIYLWSTVSIFWPSLLGLLALVVYGNTAAALSPGTFGNYILILTVFSFAIVFAISNTGVFDYLLNWLLNLKITKGRPWVLNYILLVGLYIVFIFGGGFAFLFIMWEIVYKLADIANIPRKSKYCGAMVVGMMFANLLGGYALAFKPGFLTIFGFFSAMIPIEPVNMMTTTIVLTICGFATINIYFLLIKFVIRPDLSGMKNVDVSNMALNLPPMNKRQKVSAGYLILLIAMMLLTGFTGFMGDSAIVATYGRIGILGVCWIVAALMAIIEVEGEPILKLPEVAKMIPWDTICLIAIVFGMSSAMSAADTGIGAFLTNILNPILGGKSVVMFYVIFFAAMLFLTNIFNNAIVMIMGITVIAAYLPILPLNMEIMMVMMVFMANTAFFLPSSSMQSALIYTQAEQISKQNIMFGAAFTMIAALISMVVVMIPVTSIFF